MPPEDPSQKTSAISNSCCTNDSWSSSQNTSRIGKLPNTVTGLLYFAESIGSATLSTPTPDQSSMSMPAVDQPPATVSLPNMSLNDGLIMTLDASAAVANVIDDDPSVEESEGDKVSHPGYGRGVL